jgi:hypothetical protein
MKQLRRGKGTLCLLCSTELFAECVIGTIAGM